MTGLRPASYLMPKVNQAADLLRTEADKASDPAKKKEYRQHQNGLEILAKVADRQRAGRLRTRGVQASQDRPDGEVDNSSALRAGDNATRNARARDIKPRLPLLAMGYEADWCSP